MRQIRGNASNALKLLFLLLFILLLIHLISLHYALISSILHNIKPELASNLFSNIVSETFLISGSILYAIVPIVSLIVARKKWIRLCAGLWYALLICGCELMHFLPIVHIILPVVIFYSIYMFTIVVSISFLQSSQNTEEYSKNRKEPDQSVSDLRKELYRRRRILKYHGCDTESDETVMELKSKINSLTNN